MLNHDDVKTCACCDIQHECGDIYPVELCEKCADSIDAHRALQREVLELRAAQEKHVTALKMAESAVKHANARLQAQTAEIKGMNREYRQLKEHKERLAESVIRLIDDL